MKRSYEISRETESAKRARSSNRTLSGFQSQNHHFRDNRNNSNYQDFHNPNYQVGNESANGVSRTLYFGNLPESFEISKLINQITEGAIENIKIIESKRCAFVTFVKATCAQNLHGKLASGSKKIFLNSSQTNKDAPSDSKRLPVKVGWGKPVAMNRDVSNAIELHGATRAVYLGNIELSDPISSESKKKDLNNIQFEHLKEKDSQSNTATHNNNDENMEPETQDSLNLADVDTNNKKLEIAEENPSPNSTLGDVDIVETHNNLITDNVNNLEFSSTDESSKNQADFNKDLEEHVLNSNYNLENNPASNDPSNPNPTVFSPKQNDTMEYFSENSETEQELKTDQQQNFTIDENSIEDDNYDDYSHNHTEIELEVDDNSHADFEEDAAMFSDNAHGDDLELECADSENLFKIDLVPGQSSDQSSNVEKIPQQKDEPSANNPSSIGGEDVKQIEKISESDLRKIMSDYGEVEYVRTNESKRCIFVYFMRISSAMKCVNNLSSKTGWGPPIRVNYAKDRCARFDNISSRVSGIGGSHGMAHPLSKGQMEAGYYNDGMYYQNSNNSGYFSRPSSSLTAFSGDNRGSSRGGQLNINENFNEKGNGNRCVYIGGVSADTTPEEMCNFIRGGILQSVKLVINKRACFITFIYAQDAERFTSLVKNNAIHLRNRQVKLGWGSSSGPLPRKIRENVERHNACRNVQISNLPMNISAELLLDDFKIFGEIESVHLVQGRSIGYVNFTDIMSSITLMEEFDKSSKGPGSEPEKKAETLVQIETTGQDEDKPGEDKTDISGEVGTDNRKKRDDVSVDYSKVVSEYSSCKFRYGKDRCSQVAKMHAGPYSEGNSRMQNMNFGVGMNGTDFGVKMNNMGYEQNYSNDGAKRGHNSRHAPDNFGKNNYLGNQGYGYEYGPPMGNEGVGFNQFEGNKGGSYGGSGNANIMYLNQQSPLAQMGVGMGMGMSGGNNSRMGQNMYANEGYGNTVGVPGMMGGNRNAHHGMSSGPGQFNQNRRNMRRQAGSSIGHNAGGSQPSGMNMRGCAGFGGGYKQMGGSGRRGNIVRPQQQQHQQYQAMGQQAQGYYNQSGFDPMTGMVMNQGGVVGGGQMSQMQMQHQQQSGQQMGIAGPSPGFGPGGQAPGGYYQNAPLMGNYGGGVGGYPGDGMMNGGVGAGPGYYGAGGASNPGAYNVNMGPAGARPPPNFKGRGNGNSRNMY
ncbi:Negative regulator of differentiation 1 [Smittium culicis]|uniref:Negative regulator of differentiation 1 n=1 Tax=Smittium culicis TaxID=133412 RepID=A0A1R1XVB2_9FUNG|nr:Negative regulator of differentiation 1 [Smittium culicis]